MYTDEALIAAIKDSLTYADVLRCLGLRVHSSRYKRVQKDVQRLGLDTSHFLRNRIGMSKPINIEKPLEELLLEGTEVHTHRLKKRLIKAGLLEEKCHICEVLHWQGRKLSLHLDHIDGNRRNNTLENLRLLCPNCHSLTETYCGNKNKKHSYSCLDCGIQISKLGIRCRSCSHKHSGYVKPTKIAWGNLEDLIKEVEATSYTSVAKRLNVSANAVKKHIHTSLNKRTEPGSTPRRPTNPGC